MDKLAFYVMENPNGRFAAVGGEFDVLDSGVPAQYVRRG